MIAVLVVLAVGLLVELILAWVLLDWKNQLGYLARRVEAEQYRCYACITGADVSSFSTCYGEFCPKHRAHWHLIHDLEKGMLE